MGQSLWEIITVFLLSSVKFVFGGVPLALGMGFSFFQTVTITTSGGIVGVLFFVFFSDIAIKKYEMQKLKKFPIKENKSVKRKFTRTNRTIVFVKKRFGLFGISLLTPLLFSIPLGCFLAVRYFHNKQQILIYMFSSILFWSVSIASFKFLFK